MKIILMFLIFAYLMSTIFSVFGIIRRNRALYPTLSRVFVYVNTFKLNFNKANVITN